MSEAMDDANQTLADRSRLTLPPGTVHIWQVDLDVVSAHGQSLLPTLSEDECQRAECFRFTRDRERFVAGRGTLRLLLGRYLAVSPPQIQLRYGPRGKPALAAPLATTALEFNLSHSGPLMLCAFAHRMPVGIDVEVVRPIAHLTSLTERFFAPSEHAAIHTQATDAQPHSFFQHWTCKEALLKASGEGLMQLSQIEVAIVGETAQLLRWEQSTRSDTPWYLQWFVPRPGYVAAIAVNTANPHLVFYQLTPGN